MVTKDECETLNTSCDGEAYLGDSLWLLDQLEADSIDLVITSPPFALQREKAYGNVNQREFAIERMAVYLVQVVTVSHYRLEMPNGKVIERDIVERPESVLVLPVGQQQNVMLIEEYDLGADTWQLTLPDGKMIDPSPEGIRQQAQVELREETGFRAGRFEKLIDFYSHPGYIAHKVHVLVAYDLEWDPFVNGQ